MKKNLPGQRHSAEVAQQTAASSAPSQVLSPHLEPLHELREVEGHARLLNAFVRGANEWSIGDVPDDALDWLRRCRAALPPAADRRRLVRALDYARNAELTHHDLARFVGAIFDAIASFSTARNPGTVDFFLMYCEVELAKTPTSPLAAALGALELGGETPFAQPAGAYLEKIRAAEKRINSAIQLLDSVDSALLHVVQLESANTDEARAKRAEEKAAARERFDAWHQQWQAEREAERAADEKAKKEAAAELRRKRAEWLAKAKAEAQR